jgi:hypothetical protein
MMGMALLIGLERCSESRCAGTSDSGVGWWSNNIFIFDCIISNLHEKI